MSPCEWDPAENRPAQSVDASHAEAAVFVGSRGEWHLCESCAALPRFAKYRKRVALKRAKGGAQ